MTEKLYELKKIYKELPREKVLDLPVGRNYKVYNPLTDNVRDEVANEKDIVHSKHCYKDLKYFIEEK